MGFEVTQKRLIELAEAHGRALHTAIADGNASATHLYEREAQHLGGSLDGLRAGLTTLIESVRAHAQALATDHMLSELRVAIGGASSRISISLPKSPKTSDVAKYIDNALDEARSKMADAGEDKRGEALIGTAYRAHTIIESEATNSYQAARAAAFDSLKAISDAEAHRLGFAIARKQDQFRQAAAYELRGDDDKKKIVIPMVGMRWNALGSACEKCRSADGEIRPIGFSFSLPGPSAHARCKCVRSLWAAAWPFDSEEPRGFMANETPSGEREPVLARVETAIETRDIDEEARIIRGCIASDESLDSHGTRIIAKGWNLDRYIKNPVLLWCHAASGFNKMEPEDVIGTANCYVKGKALLADLQFPPAGINPKADRVFDMMKAKILKGLSVGFRPKAWHFEGADGKRDPNGDIMVIDEAELVELSIAPIPSNPNTLAKSLRALVSAVGLSALSIAAEPGEAPADPGASMTDTATTISIPTIPAELAARLHADTVEKAIVELDKRDLEANNAKNDAVAAKAELAVAIAERDALKAEIEKRDAAEAGAEVDALVKAGRIPEDKREAALRVFKVDRDAFRTLYPKQDTAPMAHLLDNVTRAAEPAPAPTQAPLAKADPKVRSGQLIALKDQFIAEARAAGKVLSQEDAFNKAYAAIRAASPAAV